MTLPAIAHRSGNRRLSTFEIKVGRHTMRLRVAVLFAALLFGAADSFFDARATRGPQFHASAPYCAGSLISQRTLSTAASTSGDNTVPQASMHSSSCATLVTPMIVLATRQLP